ncbi:serine/threonine-protein kinase [Nocardioides sp. TF02-7]|uniref:serine/threonine-protein kinase n=1 Tax=Nocardioides sp. TF02-7 TaxID=2917724 RepID=UPI001F05AF30|nr:serine/threonine-protein kinase [Nocardioides sp. TF02-7]UMG94475.1 serine/threonine protein kinase [Nocardioides sp. TF02-7]
MSSTGRWRRTSAGRWRSRSWRRTSRTTRSSGERFTREARAQASLESSHVVAVYAHGEEDGYLYIASQLIADGDLGRLIRTAGVPPLADALDVMQQVATGLADAHDAGLVHRDIKPGNVLVRLRGGAVRAYLADFGIARRMDAQATRIGAAVPGTPTYMAPELHSGAEAGFVTDVYSLGCLLWVALTGVPPYSGTTDYQVIAGHMNDPVPQLAGDTPMIRAANRILRIAMAKEPEGRYRDAGAMRDDLQAALRLPSTPGAAVPAARTGTVIRPVVASPVAEGTVPRPPTGGDRPQGSTPTGPPRSPQPPSPQPPAARPPAARPPAAPPQSPAQDPPAPDPPPTPLPPPARGGRSRVFWTATAAAAAVVAVGVGGAAAWLGRDDPDPAPGPSPTSPAGDFTAQDPADILKASEREMKVLDSVRVTGQFREDGDSGRDVVVDLTMTADGECRGTMGYADGGSAQVLRVGGRELVKPDAEFLPGLDRAEAQAFLDKVGGRWLELTEQEDQFASVCDLDELLERDNRGGATLTNEGVVTEQQQDAVRIRLEQGSQEETYYVMVAEPHYLLRIDESADASFTYSRFDEEFDPRLPAESRIVTDTELAGG